MSTKLYKVIGKYKPHFVKGGGLYCSKGFVVYKTDESFSSFTKITRYNAPLWISLLSYIPLAARILRLGFHALNNFADGSIIGIIRKWIIIHEPGASSFKKVFKIEKGSRPLNICQAADNKLFFGEYFANDERDEVKIYTSNNGIDWEVCYTFPAGTIRHIHGIFYDIHRKGCWVLTGDSNEESGLWFTSDSFNHLQHVAGGSQNYRAVEVIIKKDGLILPTDSPVARNYIQFFDPSTKTLKQLKEIEGSVFHAKAYSDIYMVSTIVEPSRINNNSKIYLYASNDGVNWKKIYSFCRDIFPPGLMKYTTYPELIMTDNKFNNYIITFLKATKRHNNRMLAWDVNEIKDILSE